MLSVDEEDGDCGVKEEEEEEDGSGEGEDNETRYNASTESLIS